jgi:hypothetical protein
VEKKIRFYNMMSVNFWAQEEEGVPSTRKGGISIS